MPNEWFEKYALPVEDADALEQDPDKDGFTNLDEWQGNTDPTKAESHPDYTTKLHLVSATEEPFRYIFASRTRDKFGINSIDQSEPTQFLKVGDVVRGTLEGELEVDLFATQPQARSPVACRGGWRSGRDRNGPRRRSTAHCARRAGGPPAATDRV